MNAKSVTRNSVILGLAMYCAPAWSRPAIAVSQASANADLSQLTITGSGYLGGNGNDTVTLGNFGALTILSKTDTVMVVALPAGIAAGSYDLTVTGGQQ